MTAEWADLARLADTYPPSERTWHVHEMHKVFVGSGDPRSLSTIVHMSGDDLADLTEEGAREVRRDAAWIAAANPAMILRLIAALDKEGTENMNRRDALSFLKEERDALAARMPCDGGCNYGDGPMEDCSRHGRPPAEVWQIVTEVQAQRDALAARLAAVEADRDRLIDRLTAAKALHTPQPGQGPAYCQSCDERWPCPTRAVLSAAPTDTTKETDR